MPIIKERQYLDIIAETMSVPFEPVKSFGNIKKDEWHNMLVFGDNLQVLKHLLKMKEEGKLKNPDGTDGVKLVYIDPPFATKHDFKGGKNQKAYSDRIAGTEFVEYIRKRLILLKELLSENGSIYVHLDWKKSHYIKIIMDEIFGESRLCNEIIWHYRTGNLAKKQFQRKHDTILFYSKNENYTFNILEFKEYLVQIYGPEKKLSLKGANDAEDKYGVYRMSQVNDVWNISAVFTLGGEHIDFPTQKPEKLLERVIKASSNEGDIVLDCFAGAGTASAVAEKLNRKWIMCDFGKLAIYTTTKRMLNLKQEIGNKGKPLKPKPFVVYNAGLYDYEGL